MSARPRGRTFELVGAILCADHAVTSLVQVKIGCLAAGMAAGADSIDDMDLLRHGALPAVFDGVRAPSTLGSFLRSFTWGNIRQLEKVSRNLLAGRARRTPLLPGADQLAFADIDSIQRRAYGHNKQGAAFGHTKISGKTARAGPQAAHAGRGQRRIPASKRPRTARNGPAVVTAAPQQLRTAMVTWSVSRRPVCRTAHHSPVRAPGLSSARRAGPPWPDRSQLIGWF